MYSITEAGEEYLCEHNPCRTIGIMPMIGLPLLRSLFTITVTTTRWVFLGVYRGQAQHGQTKNPCKRDLWGAAGLGFEPRLTDPESVVLPAVLYRRVRGLQLKQAKYPTSHGWFFSLCTVL